MVEDEMRIAREWSRFQLTGRIDGRPQVRRRAIDSFRALAEDAKSQALKNAPVAIWLYASLIVSAILIVLVLSWCFMDALLRLLNVDVPLQVQCLKSAVTLLMVASLTSFAAAYLTSNSLQLSRNLREEAAAKSAKTMRRFLMVQGVNTREQLLALIDLCGMTHQELVRLSSRRTSIISIGLSGSAGVFLSGLFVEPFIDAIWGSFGASMNYMSLVLALLVSAVLIGLLVYLPVMYIEDVLPTRERTMRRFLYSIRKAQCNGMELRG